MNKEILIEKKVFAERLKARRELCKLTQKELAAILQISERNYQYYESQKKPLMPSLYYLLAICERLDISIDYLLNRTENPKLK